jgi:hypothetical protein
MSIYLRLQPSGYHRLSTESGGRYERYRRNNVWYERLCRSPAYQSGGQRREDCSLESEPWAHMRLSLAIVPRDRGAADA